MARTELPWLLWGRRVRPVALGLTVAVGSVAFFLLTSRGGPGVSLDGTVQGFFVGGVAASSALLLTVGWFADSGRVMQVGLMGTAGVFAARATFVLLDDQGAIQSVALSAALLVIAAGSWILEATTGDRPLPTVRKGRGE